MESVKREKIGFMMTSKERGEEGEETNLQANVDVGVKLIFRAIECGGESPKEQKFLDGLLGKLHEIHLVQSIQIKIKTSKCLRNLQLFTIILCSLYNF